MLATFQDRPTESNEPRVPKLHQSISTASSQPRKVKLQHSVPVVCRNAHHQRLRSGSLPHLPSLTSPSSLVSSTLLPSLDTVKHSDDNERSLVFPGRLLLHHATTLCLASSLTFMFSIRHPSDEP